VTIECLTSDSTFDAERMVTGDSGAESVFKWNQTEKAVKRRGAGDMKAKNGAGGGLGSHILTGPVYIKGAEPGDVLEVRIIDVKPRPSGNPLYEGKTFGANTAANWGFNYGDAITEPKVREVVTIYELDSSGEKNWAKAVYSYRWTPQTGKSLCHLSTDHYVSI
jgi:acetamidase/formamidase